MITKKYHVYPLYHYIHLATLYMYICTCIFVAKYRADHPPLLKHICQICQRQITFARDISMFTCKKKGCTYTDCLKIVHRPQLK